MQQVNANGSLVSSRLHAKCTVSCCSLHCRQFVCQWLIVLHQSACCVGLRSVVCACVCVRACVCVCVRARERACVRACVPLCVCVCVDVDVDVDVDVSVYVSFDQHYP